MDDLAYWELLNDDSDEPFDPFPVPIVENDSTTDEVTWRDNTTPQPKRLKTELDNVFLLIILFAVPRVASFRLAGRPVLLSVYIAVDVSSLIILRGLSMWSIKRHCPPTTL